MVINKTTMRTFIPQILLFLLVIITSSCIGKKKHLELISTQKATYDLQIYDLTQSLDSSTIVMSEQRLLLAERKGANDALVNMQDKLMFRIDSLQEEIEAMGESALSQQENFGGRLAQKEKELKEKIGLLEEINKMIDQQETSMVSLVEELQDSLKAFDSKSFTIEIVNGQTVVVLYEKDMFRPGSTTNVRTAGLKMLSKISEVLEKYPRLFIQITGHTDNRPPRNQKNYRDNWNVSVLRAATVARALTEDFDIGTNRILASGKGEFAPRTSNETSEGRAENHRVELSLFVPSERIVRDIRRKIN